MRIHRPTDVGQVREVTATFKQHYNFERPNQARSCGNQPPRCAFPSLPPRPPVPDSVDPNRWLQQIDGQRFVRKVRGDCTVTVDDVRYYISTDLKGQYVALEVDALARELVVYHQRRAVKRMPLKGLAEAPMPFDVYLEQMCREARVAYRRRVARRVQAA